MTTRTTTCGVCAGRNRQGTMCTSCARDLTIRLLEFAGLWTDLATTRDRRDHMPPGQGGETPLPYNPAASRLRDTILTQLQPYARVARIRHLRDLATHNWRNHDAGPELALLVRGWNEAIRQTVDIPQRRPLNIGPCPQTGCHGHIHLHAPENQPAQATCNTCGTTWDTTQFSRLGKRISAPGTRQVDIEAAATHASVTPATIRQWAATGRITITNGLIPLDQLDQARRHRTTRHLNQKWGTIAT